MKIAFYCLEIVAAFVCGAMSAVVFEYYSRIIQRTSNDWLRLAIYVVIGIPFIVVIPGGACLFIIGIGPLPHDKTFRAFWIIFVFFCWAAVGFGYIVRHRHTLTHRAHDPPSI